MTETAFNRDDVAFASHGVTCRAWHYRPALAGPAPVIVMAHGLAGTRDAGLEPYAERFAAAGLHVLLFDYRHFGASDGEPRQLLQVGRQLDDWRAAIAFARSLARVDGERVALWGSSFSGGHVISLAAEDAGIAAIAAQGPMMDGLAATLAMARYAGIGHVARLAGNGLVDQLRGLAGRAPVTVPVIAAPGEFAAMSSHDALSGYSAITPDNWRNEMTARMALTLAAYRPVARARRVRCPALIQICTRDSVAPAEAARRTAARLGGPVTTHEYDIGHFDIYVGADFERAVADQLEFWRTTLLT